MSRPSANAFALGFLIGVAFVASVWAGVATVDRNRQVQATVGAVRPPGSGRLLSGEAGPPPRLPLRCVQEHEFGPQNTSTVRLRTWTRLEAEAAYHRAAMLKRTADDGGLWNDVRRRAREASINEMLEILLCYGLGGGEGHPQRGP